VSPGFFDAVGARLLAGRDFNESDRRKAERVVIISESLAKRMFSSMDAVNRRVMWTDPVTKFIGVSTEPRRIVGVVADMDDEHLVPEPAMTIFQPLDQEPFGGRMFIHAKVDPYSLVPPVTKIIRGLADDQPVERAATLDDIRAEVLAPNRINALVFGGFAGVALLIAILLRGAGSRRRDSCFALAGAGVLAALVVLGFAGIGILATPALVIAAAATGLGFAQSKSRLR